VTLLDSWRETGEEALIAEELERQLDHFVHAKWMRAKRGEESILKAKDNVDYVSALDQAIPNVKPLYHRLCSVCHPSSATLSIFTTLEQRLTSDYLRQKIKKPY
jgi:hypothetical protein